MMTPVEAKTPLRARWFDPEVEFACRCGRGAECRAPKQPHRLLLLYLDQAREVYGHPIIVTSGNRCAWWNLRQGGEDPSEHVQADGCLGADIACSSSRERAFLLNAIRLAGITRVGVYPRHLHVGVGDAVNPEAFPSPRTWVGRVLAPG